MTTKVVTGEVRLSYANVWEPRSINGSDKEKYSVSLIIPKSDTKTLAAIEAAIEAAKQAGKEKWGGKIPAVLKTPLRDGDLERPEDPAYADSFFINANSTTQPQIVDKKVQPILDQSELYSGAYGRVSINFYPFSAQGNKGVAAGLGNIQKTRDGEPLSGGSTAAEDFAPLDDAEDDFLS